MAEAMRSCKGKIMVSINDYPDIRRVFAGFHTYELGIKYSVGANHGAMDTTSELVITNWSPDALGQLF